MSVLSKTYHLSDFDPNFYYDIYVGDIIYMDKQPIQISHKNIVEFTASDDGGTNYQMQFIQSLPEGTLFKFTFDEEIYYTFEVGSRTLKIIRKYYISEAKDTYQFAEETLTGLDIQTSFYPNDYSPNIYKYHQMYNRGEDNSIAVSGVDENQRLTLNIDYTYFSIILEYDRLINVERNFIESSTSETIPNTENLQDDSFWYLDQYLITQQIDGYELLGAEDENLRNYQPNTPLIIPEDKAWLYRGGSTITVTYYYKSTTVVPPADSTWMLTVRHYDRATNNKIPEAPETTTYTIVQNNLIVIESYRATINGYQADGSTPSFDFNITNDTTLTLWYIEEGTRNYTLYIHHIGTDTNSELSDYDTAIYLETETVYINNHKKNWSGYTYSHSNPSNDFIIKDKDTNGDYQVDLYLYYDPIKIDPNPEEPPEEETEDILTGWMISNNNKFAPKTLGDNFITDAESKARVFQYGTSTPSKLQKGAIYFVI